MEADHGPARVTTLSKLTAISARPVDPGTTHPLSPADQAMARHTLHLIFYYAENPFGSSDLDSMRVALSEVLSSYPPVTGRLTRSREGRGRWEVKCNDAGVRLLRAKVGVTLEEWLRTADGAEEKDLTAWEDMPEDPSIWSPFRIQINEFEGGGIAIGLSCTHMHADFTAAATLFKSWTEAYRHQPITHPPIFNQPSLLNGRSKSNPPNPTVTHYLNTKSTADPTPTPPGSVNMATATFKFSDPSVKTRILGLQDSCPNATPFDFLAALFWVSVQKLKTTSKHLNQHHQQNNKSPHLSVCTNSRSFPDAPLPFGYFGNALHFSQIPLNEQERVTSVADVARSVHDHVAGLRAEDFWSAWDWLEGRKTQPPFGMYGPELTCVNLEHLDLYGLMFSDGSGPVHVSCNVGNFEGEGLIVVMGSGDEGFDRTVMVALPEEDIGRLCEDKEILDLEPKIILGGRK